MAVPNVSSGLSLRGGGDSNKSSKGGDGVKAMDVLPCDKMWEKTADKSKLADRKYLLGASLRLTGFVCVVFLALIFLGAFYWSSGIAGGVGVLIMYTCMISAMFFTGVFAFRAGANLMRKRMNNVYERVVKKVQDESVLRKYWYEGAQEAKVCEKTVPYVF